MFQLPDSSVWKKKSGDTQKKTAFLLFQTIFFFVPSSSPLPRDVVDERRRPQKEAKRDRRLDGMQNATPRVTPCQNGRGAADAAERDMVRDMDAVLRLGRPVRLTVRVPRLEESDRRLGQGRHGGWLGCFHQLISGRSPRRQQRQQCPRAEPPSPEPGAGVWSRLGAAHYRHSTSSAPLVRKAERGSGGGEGDEADVAAEQTGPIGSADRAFAGRGARNLIAWARANGCPWDPRAYVRAAKARRLDMIEWLYDQAGCPLQSVLSQPATRCRRPARRRICLPPLGDARGPKRGLAHARLALREKADAAAIVVVVFVVTWLLLPTATAMVPARPGAGQT